MENSFFFRNFYNGGGMLQPVISTTTDYQTFSLLQISAIINYTSIREISNLKILLNVPVLFRTACGAPGVVFVDINHDGMAGYLCL